MHHVFPSRHRWVAATLVLAMGGACATADAQALAGDTSVVEAREAARKRDKPKLSSATAAVKAAHHPLAPWAEYWELLSRLPTVMPDEVDAFYARWPGSYLEDRLRNDWLLELGRRREWALLAKDLPRFRMNDDREVTCYGLLADHLSGKEVRDAARAAWWAQRELDDGCHQLASAMLEARKFGPDEVWRKARHAIDAHRPGAARAAIALLGQVPVKDVTEALDQPIRYVRQHVGATRMRQELRLLAVLRLAANDTDVAAEMLEARGQGTLPPALAAWGWASIGRQAALKLSLEAPGYFERAWNSLPAAEAPSPGWSDETLAWGVRSALRVASQPQRWALVQRMTSAMSAGEQANPTWIYWRARAMQARAATGPAGDEARAEARRLLESIAGPLGFYPQLAAEDLGWPYALPAPAAAPTATERDAAQQSPGLSRALHLARLGLRDEARREWNFTLRGMSDRELLAAAQRACELSDWQLCINTSDRTRQDIDVASRYPMPYAHEVALAAQSAGLEPAFVFGLIRQETRFMAQLRSSAGATGLMQLMPATARWVAKRTGTELPRADQVFDPAINLKLGTTYLKLVLDDLGGSQPLAAAAYNAGPGRPRRWREGPRLEAAVWAENIPFNETRDYVKRVLSNTVVYAALLKTPAVTLKTRLGQTIGPREVGAGVANTELP